MILLEIMKKARVRVIIQGLVQGVFFRMRTADTARVNNVSGWVRNNPDGTVEAVLEGDEVQVARVVEWCRAGGPRGARVDRAEAKTEEYKGEFDDFSIRY